MIPFLCNENRFSYFFFFFVVVVVDHLLVGQLCTNPKSDRSLLSCLKVTMFNERDRRCAAVQLRLSTDVIYIYIYIYIYCILRQQIGLVEYCGLFLFFFFFFFFFNLQVKRFKSFHYSSYVCVKLVKKEPYISPSTFNHFAGHLRGVVLGRLLQ